MKRADISLVLVLALAGSTACSREEQADLDRTVERAENGIQQTADQWTNDAREALNDLGNEFDELETRNANLQGESAAAWTEVRDQVRQIRQELANDVDRLQTSTAEEAHEVRARIARNFEGMTHRVERAKLLATDGNEEFVSEARERLAEIDQNIQSLQSDAARLPIEAREEASASVENLRGKANDIRESVMSMADAAPQQIAEQREELAEDVSSLVASVRREMLEVRADLTS